jgi:uncharacterized damage-inducible protein DinB
VAAEQFESIDDLAAHMYAAHASWPGVVSQLAPPAASGPMQPPARAVSKLDQFYVAGQKDPIEWMHDGAHAPDGRRFDEFAPTSDGDEPPG